MRDRLCLLFVVAGLAAARTLHSAVIAETFASSPDIRGWRTFGEPGLFQWNAEQQQLDVTWDSSRTNSYFYLPLRHILTREEDFAAEFDLYFHDIVRGANTNKPYTFQVAVGFVNFAMAARTNFYRGSGFNVHSGPRSLVEFNYFPDSGFGATVAPTVATTNNAILFSDNHPLEMTSGDWFHVSLAFTAQDNTLRTRMTRNGQPFGLPPDGGLADLMLPANANFRVDTFAVSSYSDAGQSPPHFAGSILAHGIVDNIQLTIPTPALAAVSGRLVHDVYEIVVLTQTSWTYALQRSTNLITWEPVSPVYLGSGGALTLTNAAAAPGAAFYRVQADRL